MAVELDDKRYRLGLVLTLLAAVLHLMASIYGASFSDRTPAALLLAIMIQFALCFAAIFGRNWARWSLIILNGFGFLVTSYLIVVHKVSAAPTNVARVIAAGIVASLLLTPHAAEYVRLRKSAPSR